MMKPSKQIAEFLMCNILGKQTDPSWVPDPVMVEFVHETLMNVHRRGIDQGAGHPVSDGEARRILHPDEYDSYRRYVAACAAQVKNAK